MDHQLRNIPSIMGRKLADAEIRATTQEAYLMQIAEEIAKADEEHKTHLAALAAEVEALRNQLNDAGMEPNPQYEPPNLHVVPEETPPASTRKSKNSAQ